MRIWIVLGLGLTLAGAGLAPAQANGTRVMENPGAHSEGDGTMAEEGTPPEGVAVEPEMPDELAAACGAADLQHLVGGPWPVELPERDGPMRVYGPNDAVTMDHNPERLNIVTTAAGDEVSAVSCG